MEPISLTLALAGLPGIFVSCVECFQYVQFGREFEGAQQMNLCKLEAAEMRLTRWGRAMGINEPTAHLDEHEFTEDEIVKAYRWLGQIKRAFDETKGVSELYRDTRTAKDKEDAKLQILEEGAQEAGGGDDILSSLHTSMHRVNESRVKPRQRDRVAWALHRKGHFETLLETINDLISNLVELFPMAVDEQKRLCCDEEVQGLNAGELQALDGILGRELEDDVFKDVLGELTLDRPDSNLFYDIHVQDHFPGHFGNNVGAAESRDGVYTKPVIKATFDDGHRVIARIPYPATVPEHYAVASEVAMLDYLRLHGFKTPKVYGWSSTKTNPVGAEYIVMEKMGGTPLCETWYTMMPKQQRGIMGQTVEWETRLISLKFPASGSLYYQKDNSSERSVALPDPNDRDTLKLDRRQKEADIAMEQMRAVVGVDELGWVPSDEYNAAKEKARDIKYRMFEVARTPTERNTIMDHHPFDDFDENS
ncbi:prion-inhibition and propagation-domain-containing protein [Aspergillus multicolor]|uniref:prion-inhibition and propagation domain-containing protein n=1 Tax=Aspergillus multicolor TaxID=41759 RepID=UPI003CCE0224